MTQRLCKICLDWHNLGEPWPVECRVQSDAKRSELTAPMFISDTMDAVQSQLDGRMYDSKSALRRTYKDGGVVELGNDAPINPSKKIRPDRTKVKASVDRAFSRAGLGA